MKRRQILLSAYACEPGEGSESGIGWNWVTQIARFHEVWALTRANNRPRIEQALAQEPLPNVHWVYFDLPCWARFWKKGARGVHLYYYLWQLGAYRVGKRLHHDVNFDLTHHLTFGAYWTPSFLSLLPPPFIWGPVGGGESAPKALGQTLSWRGRIYETLRDAARGAGQRDPFVRATARRTALALAATSETARRLHEIGCRHVQTHSNVGLPEEELDRLATIPSRSDPVFRLISIGRLLQWKGFHLGLMAFAQLRQRWPRSEYWLLGDGPERRPLEHLAHHLGVSDAVRFWGNVPRQEALNRLADCDVLVHPSLHDSGGWVCVEAMGAGRPVLCLDLGGPADQVTENAGFKIPAQTLAQVLKDLTETMLRLAHAPDLCASLGEGGRRRVRDAYLWHNKAQVLTCLYEGVLDAHTSRGALGPRPGAQESLTINERCNEYGS